MGARCCFRTSSVIGHSPAKVTLVDADNYLQQVIRYIHRNSVHVSQSYWISGTP